MFELAEECQAEQLLHACAHYIVVEFDKIYPTFPVLRDMHKRIKEQIKKYPSYVAWLKRQSKYWDSHAAVYQPPAEDGKITDNLTIKVDGRSY